METLQDRLKELLRVKKISARKLSRNIGMNDSYIAQYLAGKVQQPTDELFQYLEAYYLVNLEWLFEGGEKDKMFLPGGGPGWIGNYKNSLVRKVVALPDQQKAIVEQIVDAFTFRNQAEDSKEQQK